MATLYELKVLLQNKIRQRDKLQNEVNELSKINEPVKMDEDNIQVSQYRSAAAALMEKDPIKALELLNKADVIQERINSKKDELSPDEARRQLRIARDQSMSIVASSSPEIHPTQRKRATLEAQIYSSEMAKTNPSVQFANEKVNELYQMTKDTDKGDKGDIAFTSYNEAVKEIDNELNKIDTKGNELNTIVQRLKNKVNSDDSDLSSTNKEKLIAKIDEIVSGKKNPQAKETESPATYKAFLDGQGDSGNIISIKSAIALSNTMSDVIIEAVKNGTKLSNADTKKLAALAYKTYEPGIMQGAEAENANAQALALKTDEATIRNFLQNKLGFRIQDNLSGDLAKKLYNSAVEAGIKSWNNLQTAAKDFKSTKEKTPLLDSFMLAYKNPPVKIGVSTTADKHNATSNYQKYNFNKLNSYKKGDVLQGTINLLEVYIDKDGNNAVRKYSK